jgi:hypothetical protein
MYGGSAIFCVANASACRLRAGLQKIPGVRSEKMDSGYFIRSHSKNISGTWPYPPNRSRSGGIMRNGLSTLKIRVKRRLSIWWHRPAVPEKKDEANA